MSKRQGPRVVDLEIETLGADGFGVAQFERHPVHVKGALPGEVVSARVVRRRRGDWYALPEQWFVTVGDARDAGVRSVHALRWLQHAAPHRRRRSSR